MQSEDGCRGIGAGCRACFAHRMGVSCAALGADVVVIARTRYAERNIDAITVNIDNKGRALITAVDRASRGL